MLLWAPSASEEDKVYIPVHLGRTTDPTTADVVVV